MDITTDYNYLNTMNLLQSQQAANVDSTLQAVSEAAKAAKDSDGEHATAVFAAALREEIDKLQQRSELGTALSGSPLYSVTAGMNDISEMMESESGRRAVTAMADNAITSIVYGNDNSDGDSVLNTLTQANHSTERQLADALKDILEVLESTSGAEQMKE